MWEKCPENVEKNALGDLYYQTEGQSLYPNKTDLATCPQ